MSLVHPTLRSSSARQSCPLCRDDLSGQDQACLHCGTQYHLDCLSEFKGCSTLGCASFGLTPQNVPPRRLRRAASCSLCSLEVPVDELQPCPGCGDFAHAACASRGCRTEGCPFQAVLDRDLAERVRAYPQTSISPGREEDAPWENFWPTLGAALALVATLAALFVFEPSEKVLRLALLAAPLVLALVEGLFGKAKPT